MLLCSPFKSNLSLIFSSSSFHLLARLSLTIRFLDNFSFLLLLFTTFFYLLFSWLLKHWLLDLDIWLLSRLRGFLLFFLTWFLFFSPLLFLRLLFSNGTKCVPARLIITFNTSLLGFFHRKYLFLLYTLLLSSFLLSLLLLFIKHRLLLNDRSFLSLACSGCFHFDINININFSAFARWFWPRIFFSGPKIRLNFLNLSLFVLISATFLPPLFIVTFLLHLPARLSFTIGFLDYFSFSLLPIISLCFWTFIFWHFKDRVLNFYIWLSLSISRFLLFLRT